MKNIKKIGVIASIFALALALLTACGGGEETPSYDVNEVLNTITTAVPIAMPGEIPESELEMIMGLSSEDYVSYAGQMCMAMVSADRVVVIEAAEGKIDAVTEALETFKQSAVAQFELYLPDQYEKAQAGRIVVKGNYVVLAILGDAIVVEDEGVDAAYVPVDAAIDEAFK